MEASLVENIPSLETFLQYSTNEIKEFCEKFDIKSCYLPVDGTRRFFLLFNETKNNWNEKDLKSYFLVVNSKFREIIKLFYSYGIQNLILLLMDKSAFSRGEKYLSEAIESGIKPLYADQKYLDLYNRYDIDVQFAGFTSIFNKFLSADQLEDLISKFNSLHRKQAKNKFIIYNGLSPSDDYLLLENYANNLRKQHFDITKELLIQKIYKTNLTKIDFSIWYGYPRDKIIPPLLWEDGPKFFVRNPTLSLQPVQIKKAIYFCAVTKYSIKDDYYNHNFTDEFKRNERESILSEESILGPEFYYLD